MAHRTDPPLSFLLLPSAERILVADYWRKRGVGEMGAELAFGQVREDLGALGAPAPLLRLAERATQDERKHGLWGREFSLYFGGTDESEPVAERTRTLTFPGATERQNRVLRVVFCGLNETVGCHVLQDVRPRMVDPILRKNNQQHLSDELQHARVAWGLLGLLDERDRETVRRYLPLLLALVQKACCEGAERNEFDHLVPYGYFTPKILRAAYERALREVIEPGLSHLHIEEAA